MMSMYAWSVTLEDAVGKSDPWTYVVVCDSLERATEMTREMLYGDIFHIVNVAMTPPQAIDRIDGDET